MYKAILNLIPSIVCRIATSEKILFLTFDDGPVPEATQEVLGLLSAYNARATFFCIGENIDRHPAIFSRIINEGHATGNHTYNHLNGWKTLKDEYIHNVRICSNAIMSKNNRIETLALFRPPYGKMKPGQYFALRKQYKIVLWDVLTRDWEPRRKPESCFARIRRKAKPGSIIVFHDSIKAKQRMIPALEKTLSHYSKLGYRFESLAGYL